MSTAGSGNLSAPGEEGNYSPVTASWEEATHPADLCSSPQPGREMIPPRVWPGMLPLLMLEGLETTNSVVSSPLSALVLLLTL